MSESALLADLDAALSLAWAFLGEPSDAAGPAFFAEVGLMGSVELAQGVASEVRAKRPANASRLARHQMEWSLDLGYVAADFGPRMRQWLAREAEYILERASLSIPDRRLKTNWEATLEEARARHESFKALPKTSRTLSEDGFLPRSRKQMAEAIGWDKWAENYLHISQISHPGWLSVGPFLQPEQGSAIDGGSATHAETVLETSLSSLEHVLSIALPLRGKGWSERLRALLAASGRGR